MKKIIPSVLIFLLMAQISFAAESAPPLSEQRARLYQRVGDAYNKNNFAQVRELLCSDIEADKPHHFALILYGLACLQQGKAGEAAEVFAKGINTYPENFSLNNNFAIALMRLNRYSEAAERFEITANLAAENNRAGILYSAAQAWYQADNFAKAATLADKLISTDKDTGKKTEYIRLAAASYLALENWPKAEEYFATLVLLRPRDKDAWRALAQSRLRRNNYTGAGAAYEVLCRLPDTTPGDWNVLINIYKAANAPLLSIQAVERAKGLSEREREIIGSLSRAGRNDKLIAYLDARLNNKASSALYLEQGIVRYRMRNLTGAQESFRKGAEKGQKEADRCRMLEGLLAWERMDYDTALQAFSKIRPDSRLHAQARQAISSIKNFMQAKEDLLTAENQ